MSSKRDLVEAHSFNRRRLVTAFVSGAPGGREVEPVRYARALVAGAVLAALVVVGAAVGGLIKPKLPSGWNDNGLVIAKESGARFIAQGDRLFPVINTASARLIAADDQGEMAINTVPDDKLRGMDLRATIGIAGAPDALPSRSELINTGWSACVSKQGGLRVSISSVADVREVSSQALLVSSVGDGGQQFLVVGGKRFPISARNGDNILRTLGLPSNGFQASGSWVNLLDLGPEIKPFTIPRQGESVDTGVPGLDRVGMTVRQGGRPYLLVAGSGKPGLLPISDFAYAVYASGGAGAGLRGPDDVTAAQLSRLQNVDSVPGTDVLTQWPQSAPTAYRQATPCVLMTGNGDFRQTSLATVTSSASDRLPTDRLQSVAVESGRGALVQETSASVRSDQGSDVLIDATGTRYTVPRVSVGRLGYADVAAPSVSQAWTVLFKDGPTLDPQQATGSPGTS